MDTKPKLYLVWMFLLVLLGILVGYLSIKGIVFAYDVIFNQNEKISIFKEEIQGNSDTQREIAKEILRRSTTEQFLNIGFVGDIIPGTNASSDIFIHTKEYTEKPDLMIGNFEGVVTTHTYQKCKIDSLKCFAFNGDSTFLKFLDEASFDVLNLANNHSNDYGEVGKEDTRANIHEAGMIASGMKNKITYLKGKNMRVGVVGFSNYFYTSDMNSTKNVTDIVSEAEQNTDIVIVIFHGGGEGEQYTNITNDTEWYLGENRGNPKAFAHSAIDAGADIVLGSGPHILRGMEWYKDRLIAYSLGNFASASPVSTYGKAKISAMLDISLKKNGSFISGSIISLELKTNGIPYRDIDNTAIININSLSKEDFGEYGVVLNPLGEILKI